MEVRLARTGEESDIARLYNLGFSRLIEELDPVYGWKQVQTDDVMHWSSGGKSQVWVAGFDDSIVGYAQTTHVTESGLNEVEVQWISPCVKWDFSQGNLVVHPDHRGRGVATSILTAVIEDSRAKGYDLLHALTFSDNVEGEGLLRKLGFQRHDVLVYPRFSTTQPIGNSSIYVSRDLTKPLPSVSVPEDMEIRAARPSDAEDVSKIHRANVWWNRESWSEEWNLKYVRGEMGHRVLVAEADGRVIGAMDYFDRGTIGIAGVLPEFRRRGIGSALFLRLLEVMRDKGISRAFADSGLTQREAISMYHRFEFDVERTQTLWSLSLSED